MPPCCHCRRNKAQAKKRGLCWTCWRDPAVRAITPLRTTEQWQPSEIADSYGPRPWPPEPTQAEPGSEEKIVVLQGRAAAGLQLHHSRDKRVTAMNLLPPLLLTPTWEINLPDGHSIQVRALTRGEARAAAKRELGLHTKRARLPVGTKVRRLPE